MAIRYENKDSFERVRKFLIENQYAFEYIETEDYWEIIIKEWD